MFSKILAAVDSSPRARAVVDTAAEVADKFAGEVHLFRVITLPPEFPAAARNPPDDLERTLCEQARRELTILAGDHRRIVIDPPEAGPREPWRAILDRAKVLGVGLIVIGSHGFGGWDRVLGTTAGKVADHADRPVLVVHRSPDPGGNDR